MIDLDARIIERWQPGEERPEILADRIEWTAPGAVEPLLIELEGFFDEVES